MNARYGIVVHNASNANFLDTSYPAFRWRVFCVPNVEHTKYMSFFLVVVAEPMEKGIS